MKNCSQMMPATTTLADYRMGTFWNVTIAPPSVVYPDFGRRGRDLDGVVRKNPTFVSCVGVI